MANDLITLTGEVYKCSEGSGSGNTGHTKSIFILLDTEEGLMEIEYKVTDALATEMIDVLEDNPEVEIQAKKSDRPTFYTTDQPIKIKGV